MGIAAGEFQIAQRLVVDGKIANGRAVFRPHVADGRAVRQAQARQPGAVELDEFFHDALFAQHLHDGEHQIRRGGAFGQACRAV